MKDRIKNFISRESDYKKTFETDHGKRVLIDIIKSCNLLNTTFSKDFAEMSFKEGARNVALVILTRLHKDHSDLIKLLQENEDDRPADRFNFHS